MISNQNTTPNGSTHQHYIGSMSLNYKRIKGIWHLWSGRDLSWVLAMVNTVYTQPDGTPCGFVEITSS